MVGEGIVNQYLDPVLARLHLFRDVHSPWRRDADAGDLAIDADFGRGNYCTEVERNLAAGLLWRQRDGLAIPRAAGVALQRAHLRPVAERGNAGAAFQPHRVRENRRAARSCFGHHSQSDGGRAR